MYFLLLLLVMYVNMYFIFICFVYYNLGAGLSRTQNVFSFPFTCNVCCNFGAKLSWMQNKYDIQRIGSFYSFIYMS